MYTLHKTELVDYWLAVNRLWRGVTAHPIIRDVEKRTWPDHSPQRRRYRSFLLNPDVMVVALWLYRAESGQTFSIGRLSHLIAVDQQSTTTLSNARQRMRRILSVLEVYELVDITKAHVGNTIHYQIGGTERLNELVEGMIECFPAPPRAWQE